MYKQFIDNGNGRFKGKDNHNRKAKMLAVVGTGFTRKHKMPLGIEEDGFIPTDQIHVAVRDLNSPNPHPQEYFVGQTARNESVDGERVFNTGSVSDYRIAVAVATMSALLNTNRYIVDRMCLGLPLGIYHEKRNELKNLISNINMQVEFQSGSDTEGPVLVRPRAVEIYPQSAAGLYACIFNSDGSFKFPGKPGLYASTDIGWGTTDFMVLEVLPNGKVQVRGDMTYTIEMGISRIVDITRTALENKFGSVNRNEFENQILTNPSCISYRGQEFNLVPAWEQAKRQVALSIINGVKGRWGDKAEYVRKTFVFGGGADDLKESLFESFPTQMEVPEEPDTVNLRGFEIMDTIGGN